MPRDHAVALGSDAQEDWPAIFDQYSVRFLALDSHKDHDLLQLFRSHPEWGVDTEDGGAVLLAHSRADHNDHGRAV